MAGNISERSGTLKGMNTPLLDVDKIQALPTEQKDIFLLNHVAELHQYVLRNNADAISTQQSDIKREVFRIIALSSPAPSRIIRLSLAQILGDVFSRGDRKLLVETVNDLLSIINASKNEKDIAPRFTAVVCLGFVCKNAGDSVMSLHGLVIASLLRSLKIAQLHAGFRASIFRTLGLCIEGFGQILDEVVARDVWKQLRVSAASDKSALVQRFALHCMGTLFVSTTYFSNNSDFEIAKSLIWKLLDSPVKTTRRIVSRTLARILLSVFTTVKMNEGSLVVKKAKKAPKTKAVEEDADTSPQVDHDAESRTGSQLVLNLTDILKSISAHYCRTTTSNLARGELGIAYKAVLSGLPDKTVQSHYADIADHFFTDVLSHHSIFSNRVRLLQSRKIISTLLRDVVASQQLTEDGQINACRWLVNDVLKNYPQVIAGRKEPSKNALCAALDALSHLLQQLGPAAVTLQDSCREGLFQAATHPSYSVQVQVASAFGLYVSSCRSQLLPTLKQALTILRKQLEDAETKSLRKVQVYALSIAAMLKSAQQSPLFGSTEFYAELFTEATELLKASASSSLRLCAIQIQVAWTLLAGLLSLGPSFTKVHVNQLMLLWRNAMPPPLSSENATVRGPLETSFLCHVRETALNALTVFVRCCGALITSDGSKRIAAMLQNSIAFMNSLPAAKNSDDLSLRVFPALRLHDHIVALRRRILQCSIGMLSLGHIERNEVAYLSEMAGLATRIITEPDRPNRNLESSISQTASIFTSIWTLSDNWSSGINALINRCQVTLHSPNHENKIGFGTVEDDLVESTIADTGESPLISALEHDPITILENDCSRTTYTLRPETMCVTYAIQLFGIILPLQNPRVQEGCLEQFAVALGQTSARDPERRAVLQLNTITACIHLLAVSNRETSFVSGALAVQSISKIVGELCRRCLLEHDAETRSVASEALARLCCLAGNQFTNTEVKNLIDTIIANREPHVRAGCALALGKIHAQIGPMAASFHLKSIVSVLLSLCADAHPTVHYWALQGLATIADSAGLGFSNYTTSTLGMLAQLYSNDSHNEESGSLMTSNIEMDNSTPLVVGQSLDALINVLGPDLQDATRTRNLILRMLQYFGNDTISGLILQSQVSEGHIALFAPAHIQLSGYVHRLQDILKNGTPVMQASALLSLETTIKRNAAEVFLVSKPGLSEQLWSYLDSHPNHVSLQNTMRSWMQQTCLSEPALWIEQCQSILSKTRGSAGAEISVNEAKPKTAAPELADDEVAGFATSAAVIESEKTGQPLESQEYLRWQTRAFAMTLLSEMLEMVQNAMLADELIEAESVVQSKIGEIIRIAFSAATAPVVQLRAHGLQIIDQILHMFGRTPDPDFLEASLLEQYQAQISSALTPAFALDSTAELAAKAITVCSTFVAAGIVTNVERMGRIFKVLSSGIDSLEENPDLLVVGDLRDLTPNAQSLLKMSLLKGWAQLQLASHDQSYLEELLQPYVDRLSPLWLASLQEFASLRFEPEISDTLADNMVISPGERYIAMDREVRLAFYQDSWLSIVDAIALLVEKDSDAVFEALDHKMKQVNGHVHKGQQADPRHMRFREEPVAFFFILFGLTYEALVTQTRDDSRYGLSLLSAMKRILKPSVAGVAIYQDAVFDEFTNTLDRLALTGAHNTQNILVRMARNLALDHVIANSDRGDKLSDDIDQLFELARIVILILAGSLPTIGNMSNMSAKILTEDSIELIRICLEALVDISEVFPSIIRCDLHACIMHSYCTILATGVCQAELVPRIIPTFRKFLQSVAASPDTNSGSNSRFVLGALSQMLTTLTIAQRRENDFAISCARNTLLSMTVLLTTVSKVIPAQDKLVSKATEAFLETLQDVGIAKTTATCIRSLLTTPVKSKCDETIARAIWPSVVRFVVDASADDPEGIKLTLLHALVSSTASLREQDARPAAFALLIPCLLTSAAPLDVQNSLEKPATREVAERLLELAGIDAQTFRAVVARLPPEQRSVLEALLRSTTADTNRGRSHIRTMTGSSRDQDDSQPAIALRMDF